LGQLSLRPPFIPDVTATNHHAPQPEPLESQATANPKPKLTSADQEKFVGFDYRTCVMSAEEGLSSSALVSLRRRMSLVCLRVACTASVEGMHLHTRTHTHTHARTHARTHTHTYIYTYNPHTHAHLRLQRRNSSHAMNGTGSSDNRTFAPSNTQEQLHAGSCASLYDYGGSMISDASRNSKDRRNSSSLSIGPPSPDPHSPKAAFGGGVFGLLSGAVSRRRL
jgi:hypothetical protein